MSGASAPEGRSSDGFRHTLAVFQQTLQPGHKHRRIRAGFSPCCACFFSFASYSEFFSSLLKPLLRSLLHFAADSAVILSGLLKAARPSPTRGENTSPRRRRRNKPLQSTDPAADGTAASGACVPCCWKQERHNTGLPWVGLKGTVVSAPHWAQAVRVSCRLLERPRKRFVLQTLQRLGSFLNCLSWKKSCSPAVKTNDVPQSTHLSARSSNSTLCSFLEECTRGPMRD